MKKILSLVFVSLILTSCGESKDTESNLSNTQNISGINHEYFNLTLPEKWKVLDKNPDSFFQAQFQENSFIVHLIEPKTDKPVQEILNKVRGDFFQWKLINKPENNMWSFKGKIEVILPNRTFEQKLLKIPESSRYFLGSCSFENPEKYKDICKNILNSWNLK